MKHPEQIKTAPLNRASDLMTAREINAAFVPEIHIVDGQNADAVADLFRARGWLVIIEPGPKSASELELETSLYEPHRKMAKGPRTRLQPRSVRQSKGTRRRSKV